MQYSSSLRQPQHGKICAILPRCEGRILDGGSCERRRRAGRGAPDRQGKGVTEANEKVNYGLNRRRGGWKST